MSSAATNINAKKIAALIVSRNRPDLVQAMVEQIQQRVRVPCDVFVVECGTDLDKLTPHTSAWYPDPDFRGKCYGHNIALQLALMKDCYDYYWVLMNDLVFAGEGDPAAALVETLERESRMAILSPTNVEGGYPESAPQAGGDWRAVTTCDYLGFMLRASALEQCGFLNPDFKYCWGAIHELAFQLYAKGWFVAYSDRVSYRHLGGSTYGAKGTNTISRAEYQRNAKRFAYDHFRERYGEDWDEVFQVAARPFHTQGDTFRKHKRLWSTGFDAEELAVRAGGAAATSEPGWSIEGVPGITFSAPKAAAGKVANAATAGNTSTPAGITFSAPRAAAAEVVHSRPAGITPTAAGITSTPTGIASTPAGITFTPGRPAAHKKSTAVRPGITFSAKKSAAKDVAAPLLPGDQAGLIKLHLGCGKEKRAGWINIDTLAEVNPDVIANVDALTMFGDGVVDVIEAHHLFEHLTYSEARRALREWSRVLKPGGELFLELPDLEACIRILGQHQDKRGIDLGMIGIYGWPPDIDAQGVPQMHKWGWTRGTLTDELRGAGFTTVEFGPITQTWRPAAQVGRDMRLRAVRAGDVRVQNERTERVATGSTYPQSARVEHSTARKLGDTSYEQGVPKRSPAERPDQPVAGALELSLEAQASSDPSLATNTNGERLHLFAWPDWSSLAEIDHLIGTFGRALVGVPDAGLVLRFDAELDGPRENAIALLADAHRRLLGEDASLEVHFVEKELDASEWDALGQNITAVAELASSAANPRRAVALALNAPAVADGQAWLARVAQLRAQAPDAATTNPTVSHPNVPHSTVPDPNAPGASAPTWSTPGGATPSGTASTAIAGPLLDLRARIAALNPWFYPLRIGAIDVTAGVNSPVSHEFLVNHTHCRASLLVDEVARRYELRGKSVLELASNCGYWSSRYAQLGATRVVGLEGREQFLRQAELYWSEGQFLPREDVRFLRGNISDRRDWAPLAALAPFDFTLIAGILYHVPNYREVLRWASELTREALVIDTRVVHGRETLVDEPGELRFNAIEATRSKIVPNLEKLVAALEELGFAAEILPVAFPEAVGVERVDSFVQKNRVAIFARRVRVPSARQPSAALSA